MNIVIDGKRMQCNVVVVELDSGVATTFPHEIIGNKYIFEQMKREKSVGAK